MTTRVIARAFMYEAIPAAVRPTTARFMQDGPGPTGPRSPAVPNSRKPEKYFFKVISSSAATSAVNWAAVFGSGSSAIHACTSASSSAFISTA